MVDSADFQRQYTMDEVRFADVQGFEGNMDVFVQQSLSFKNSSDSDLWVPRNKANQVSSNSEELCMICCEKKADTTMYPVYKHKGHENLMCSGCAKKVKETGKGCPCCRRQFRLPEDFMKKATQMPKRNLMRRPSL